ncbi:thermonuclease family protein [Rhodobacteraceae bacterium 63075]|nr:thermonuclease family protein [Rhodobacteraceae bacterium 63075]
MLRKVNAALAALCLLALPAPIAAETLEGRVEVVDGDTIRLGGQPVRLHGIDAPEQSQTCESAEGARWACGSWVTQRAKGAFEGRIARCEAVDIDRYERIVARCEAGGVDMGQWLVSEGLAFAYRKYSMAYDLDEKRAAVNDRGLHASRVQSPAQFRRSQRKEEAPPDPACRIKGNISAKGVKIFHAPGQQHYTRTRISTRKGERWFCSAQEARAAGWRKARR